MVWAIGPFRSALEIQSSALSVYQNMALSISRHEFATYPLQLQRVWPGMAEVLEVPGHGMPP